LCLFLHGRWARWRNPGGVDQPVQHQPSRIEAVGLGEEQLLRPANPEAGENRRVQLINVGPAR
jgi:hypothetical protein